MVETGTTANERLLREATELLTHACFYAGFYHGHEKNEAAKEWIERADAWLSELRPRLKLLEEPPG